MPYGMTPGEYQTLLEERNREVGEWYRQNAKREHEPKITKRVSQSHAGPERKQKLIESTKETKKELVEVSEKPYHIGTLLPEAKRAYYDLTGELQESITAQPVTLEGRKERSKQLGALLPGAVGAYRRLISNG